MTDIPTYFRLKTYGVANPEAVVRGPGTRFTVLTSRAIRIEYSPREEFEDRPTQVVWFRYHTPPYFDVVRSENGIEIETEHLHLRYQPDNASEPFAQQNLTIVIKNMGEVWEYGMVDQKNLGGTIRTLDTIDGSLPLEPGLVSRAGWSVVDDTKSLVFNSECWLEAKSAEDGYKDFYFFGYGRDYQSCLEDYFKLAGLPGFVPRWALGNWWSRYWEYTDQELRDLMLDFKKNEIPLSVCIIDMDWHITQTGNQSSGWTGYTWNKELFPNPHETVQFLHNMGLKTGLNLHPAEGIHPHEAMYPQMAEAVGINPASEEPVPFDIEVPEFAIPYFEFLHHPQEDKVGIDFWWMDWQQGNPNRLPGLNLLWWINHLHYIDSGRNEKKRSFLFSRWGGLGNHRYPIGFSGDTVISWDSLAFQPYLTATAANVGFGWWSHDIGGHMGGITDAELFTRWVQLGLFSPIFRLHSTKNPFLERRPWGYDQNTYAVTKEAMRLRHSLIPYIYSMAWRDHLKGVQLIKPMYYEYPELDQAYACPNQYKFGSELIVAPFITPINPELGLARQVLWLPKGTWFDFFNGTKNVTEDDQGSWKVSYGDLKDIPVFAKAGAILPLANLDEFGGVKLPHEITIKVFPGADNTFELYEDNGESSEYENGAFTITRFTQRWENLGDTCHLVFTIHPVVGDYSILPSNRTFNIEFISIGETSEVKCSINGVLQTNAYHVVMENDRVKITNIRPNPDDEVVVELLDIPWNGSDQDNQKSKLVELHRLLHSFKLNNNVKVSLQRRVEDIIQDFHLITPFKMALSTVQLRAILETVTESGVDFISNTGKDLIILWNNHEDPEIKWLYMVEQAVWRNPENRFQNEQGAIPKFRSIVPEDEMEIQWRGRTIKLTGIVQLDYKEILRGEIVITPRDKKDKKEIGWH